MLHNFGLPELKKLSDYVQLHPYNIPIERETSGAFSD